MDWDITPGNKNQFGSSRFSDNQDSIYWTVFHKMKNVDIFFHINIVHLTYKQNTNNKKKKKDTKLDETKIVPYCS